MWVRSAELFCQSRACLLSKAWMRAARTAPADSVRSCTSNGGWIRRRGSPAERAADLPAWRVGRTEREARSLSISRASWKFSDDDECEDAGWRRVQQCVSFSPSRSLRGTRPRSPSASQDLYRSALIRLAERPARMTRSGCCGPWPALLRGATCLMSYARPSLTRLPSSAAAAAWETAAWGPMCMARRRMRSATPADSLAAHPPRCLRVPPEPRPNSALGPDEQGSIRCPQPDSASDPDPEPRSSVTSTSRSRRVRSSRRSWGSKSPTMPSRSESLTRA